MGLAPADFQVCLLAEENFKMEEDYTGAVCELHTENAGTDVYIHK